MCSMSDENIKCFIAFSCHVQIRLCQALIPLASSSDCHYTTLPYCGINFGAFLLIPRSSSISP